MDYKNQYDKTTNKTIEICLNCEKIICTGECRKVKRPQYVKKGRKKHDKSKIQDS